MTLDEFRKEMESYRRSADEEARSLKDSYLALQRLKDLYRRFDDQERLMADQVIVEWALSSDENLRFDALALIREFEIASAAPALRQLAERLSTLQTPGAPYELRKVHRILDGLPGAKR